MLCNINEPQASTRLINESNLPKPFERPYSRYSHDALALLGQLIREGRLAKSPTTAELATRAGISRALLQRIERGDPGCAIGAVFEAAAICGVALFESYERALAAAQTDCRLVPIWKE